ncbi:hypothetical protein BB560_003940 [Smittium megazygosporum]|uniref:J domain-containing protein n=1 Tax=Smittium megazygosporum TaxID=133381 RepID=A0A2T9ZAR8_9FUNG|nr:hypothetical protein BB560_003940 [Smittium megazygosporum]
MDDFVDFYQILGVEPTATLAQIRSSYMKKALEVHPDKNPSPDAKVKFQELAEAYEVLSNPSKRKSYDYEYNNPSMRTHYKRTQTNTSDSQSQKNANNVFGDVFEELLRPEVAKHTSIWRNVGAVSGGALGFIMANIPGAIAGAFAGASVGTIRDRKGKAVMEVFQDLPYSDRIKILAAISAKVLLSNVSV